jgi:putative toxin-antitoxin system antitoxin component (TIGR02293 family)
MAVPRDIQETLSLLQVRRGPPPHAAGRPRINVEHATPELPSAVDPGDTGWSTLGERGIPAQALVELASALGLSGAVELAGELGLAERTLQRRLAKRQHLSSEEAERSIRVARALVKARHVLEDEDAGARWLLTPSKALGGRRPLSLLGSGDGFTAVMDELGRIDHGVFS